MRSGLPSSHGLLGPVVSATLIFAASGVAHARTEVQGVVSASTGWTNNAGAATDAVGASSTSSVFTTVTPGLEVFWESTKTVYRLTYNVGLSFFYSGEGTTSLSNNVSLSAAHTFSPRVDGLIDFSAAHIQNNTNVLGASASGQINALPSGTSQFLTFSMGTGLAEEISPRWRAVQGATASYTTPVDGDGFVAGASLNGLVALGLDRVLELGSIGISMTGGYTWIEGIADPLMPDVLTAEQKTVQATALGRWNRELSAFWSADVSAGFGGAALANELGEVEYFPTGSATLNYTVERGSAGIGYSHGVSFNPFIRSTIVADDAIIRGGLPIGSSRWLASGAIGYQHARTILTGDLMEETTIDLFSIDLAVTYQITPAIEFGARYQFANQNGDSELVPDQIRNSVSAVLTARYPDKTRTTVPFRQPLRMLRDPALGNESGRPRPSGI